MEKGDEWGKVWNRRRGRRRMGVGKHRERGMKKLKIYTGVSGVKLNRITWRGAWTLLPLLWGPPTRQPKSESCFLVPWKRVLQSRRQGLDEEEEERDISAAAIINMETLEPLRITQSVSKTVYRETTGFHLMLTGRLSLKVWLMGTFILYIQVLQRKSSKKSWEAQLNSTVFKVACAQLSI